jgi:hypothetical protein
MGFLQVEIVVLGGTLPIVTYYNNPLGIMLIALQRSKMGSGAHHRPLYGGARQAAFICRKQTSTPSS